MYRTDHRRLSLHRSLPQGHRQHHRVHHHGDRERRGIPLQRAHHLCDLRLLRRRKEDNKAVENMRLAVI